jgi:SAM-dependent MidA family methyltransferase
VSEYYHPQRAAGTLMAHRRHRASVDVLALPGLQDITAHVDFSAVAAAAAEAGGTTIGYTSQARFLIDCGIADLLRGDAADIRGWAPQAAALQTLLSEAEMGELFKVIAIARTPRELIGFGTGDRRESL